MAQCCTGVSHLATSYITLLWQRLGIKTLDLPSRRAFKLDPPLVATIKTSSTYCALFTNVVSGCVCVWASWMKIQTRHWWMKNPLLSHSENYSFQRQCCQKRYSWAYFTELCLLNEVVLGSLVCPVCPIYFTTKKDLTWQRFLKCRLLPYKGNLCSHLLNDTGLYKYTVKCLTFL